ncbi:MAG: twin-arginine translocation signal domain-containing protein, partial [Hyphomicrobiales bacterium]
MRRRDFLKSAGAATIAAPLASPVLAQGAAVRW